jgi:zinc/manganese transport system ATP-binding protein
LAPIRLDQATLCRGGRTIVSGLTGVFEPGSLTAVAGPNGSGKSTLLQALCAPNITGSCSAGSDPAGSGWAGFASRPGDTVWRSGGHRFRFGGGATFTGRIDRGGMDARAIALLPQEGRLDRSFPVSCRDVVALGWTARIGLFREIGPEQYAAADRALAEVGLDGLGHRPIGALSAGQFQRVLFARTIIRDAPVILLDEPFSAVDAETEAALMSIVRGWHRRGRTVIAVLHDLDLVRAEFPQTLLLAGDPSGLPLWGATSSVLTARASHRMPPRGSAQVSETGGSPLEAVA